MKRHIVMLVEVDSYDKETAKTHAEKMLTAYGEYDIDGTLKYTEWFEEGDTLQWHTDTVENNLIHWKKETE